MKFSQMLVALTLASSLSTVNAEAVSSHLTASSHLQESTHLASLSKFAAAMNMVSSLWDYSEDKHPGNALSKVIKMLVRLKERIDGEIVREKELFIEYMEWCKKAKNASLYEIQFVLQPEADKYYAILEITTADIKAAQAKIDELSQGLITLETQLAMLTKNRNRDAADYAEDMENLKNAIEAVGHAIQIIDKEMKKTAALNVGSFLQQTKVNTTTLDALLQTFSTMMDAVSLPADDKKKLLFLIQTTHQEKQKEDDSENNDDELEQSIEQHAKNMNGAKQPAYESRSGDIFELLKSMKEKGMKMQYEMELDEADAIASYKLVKARYDQDIKAQTALLDVERKEKAEALEKHIEAEREYNRYISDIKHNKQLLRENEEDCLQWEVDHAAYLNSTKNEKIAIDEARIAITGAIDDMGGDGGFTKVEGNEIPYDGTFSDSSDSDADSAGASFLQTEMEVSEEVRLHVENAKAKVVAIVKKLAIEHHSMELAQLASRVKVALKFASHSRDPFEKVKGLIVEMIKRLREKITAETSEKQFCDGEMKKTEEDLKALGVDIDHLILWHETSEAKEYDVLALRAATSDAIKEGEEEFVNRTEAYNRMRRNYALSVKELTDGLAGVAAAIKSLVGFYGEPPQEAEPETVTALVQVIHQAIQQVKDGDDLPRAKTQAGHGIIEILRLIEDDMARALALAEKDMEDEKINYGKLMEEFHKMMAIMKKDMLYYDEEAIKWKAYIQEYLRDKGLKLNAKETLAMYYLHLRERCIASPATYEEKRQKRLREIEGLNTALNVLNDETVYLQKFAKARRSLLRGHHRQLQID